MPEMLIVRLTDHVGYPARPLNTRQPGSAEKKSVTMSKSPGVVRLPIGTDNSAVESN
jgi:hypothetical protein